MIYTKSEIVTQSSENMPLPSKVPVAFIISFSSWSFISSPISTIIVFKSEIFISPSAKDTIQSVSVTPVKSA